MTQTLKPDVELMPDAPDISALVIEDDTPVDNFFSAKQQRLLVDSLYSSWISPMEGQTFLVDANIGVFFTPKEPPLVPDVFLSLDVKLPHDFRQKKNRTYLVWEFGKPPDVTIEVVSNRECNELGSKLNDYARIRVSYYVVFDPLQVLGSTPLRIFELKGNSYEEMTTTWFEKVGLGLTLWEGSFEGEQDEWLRWCDRDGIVIRTGAERAEQERQRAEQERQRAEQERQRAEQAEARAALLAERLRAMGITFPDDEPS